MSVAPTSKSDVEQSNHSTPAAAAHSTHALSDQAIDRRNALQALLAFSSLHTQVRERRDQYAQQSSTADVSKELLEAEQFVLDEVLQLVAERALAITGADGVAIALAEGDEIVCRGSAGIIAPDPGVRLDPNAGLSGACFRTGKLVRCDDIEIDSRVNLQICRRLGARSMLAVPLCGRNSVVGLLEVFSVDAYAFNDSDVRSLNLLAELILGALKPKEEALLAQAAEAATRNVTPNHDGDESAREALGQEDALITDESLFRGTSPIFGEAYNEESSRPGLRVVAAVVVVAALLAGGVWWRISRAPNTVAKAAGVPPNGATQRVQGRSASRPEALSSPATPESSSLEHSERADATPVAEPSITDLNAQRLAVLPSVNGIRHWSSTNASTVVIDLQGQVQYEAHRLTDPDRIYFDLHDTALAPGLSTGKVIEVDDSLLTRVRVAQLMVGVTRIVLETKGNSNFSVSLEPNPYRLVVQIRAIGAGDAEFAPRPELFPPVHEPKRSASLPSSSSFGRDDDARLRAQIPKFRIVLDAGHGGWDLGSVGSKGLLEKDLVFDITKRLGKLLENRLACEVIYTRKDDTYVALDQRAEVANEAQADLFVSIHANYSNLKSARGVETYYTNFFAPSGSGEIEKRENGNVKMPALKLSSVDLREKVGESRKLASAVQRSLHGTLSQQSAEIRNRGIREASFVVLTGTTMPGILAEVSFVSSPDDESSLKSAAYRQEIAEALYKGITRYEASSHHVKMASARPTNE